MKTLIKEHKESVNRGGSAKAKIFMLAAFMCRDHTGQQLVLPTIVFTRVNNSIVERRVNNSHGIAPSRVPGSESAQAENGFALTALPSDSEDAVQSTGLPGFRDGNRCKRPESIAGGRSSDGSP